MAITENEKKCLKLADEFAKDAARSIGFVKGKYAPMGEVEMRAGMLGDLAADKYRACMKDAERTPVAARNAR